MSGVQYSSEALIVNSSFIFGSKQVIKPFFFGTGTHPNVCSYDYYGHIP
jgi:hypothetical protein